MTDTKSLQDSRSEIICELELGDKWILTVIVAEW